MAPVLWLVGVAVAVAAADQGTKRAVVRRLAPGERRELPLGLALAHVRNARGALVALPLPVAIGLALGGAAVALASAVDPTLGVAAVTGLGLAVGGMAGNVVDRVRSGAVVDIVALGRWRVVNLADAALVVGALAVGGAALAGLT